MTVKKHLGYLAVAAVLTAGTTTYAAADGMPSTRGYAPVAYNWSGFYAGASIGYARTDAEGYYSNFLPRQNFNADADSGVLGGHVGIQHQFGQFVLGVEGGYSSTRVFDDWGGGTLGPSASCLAINPVPTTCQARIDHIYTIGPRLGLAYDRSLFYVTGGFAGGQLNTRLLDRSTTPVSVFDRTSENHVGWFIGGGLEFALSRNWIFGVEYQHIELDSEKHLSSADAFNPAGVNARTMDADVDIVRARLSFKFGRDDNRYAPLK